MNTHIFKYIIPILNHFSISIPIDAKILTLQLLELSPVIWIEVNPVYKRTLRYFQFIPTGGKIPQNSIYIGTIQTEELVYHLYDLGYSPESIFPPNTNA